MISKYYEKIKNFIKQNYLILTFYLVFIVTMTYQFPYYIYVGGGVLDTNDKVKIKNEYHTKGTFNLSYVSQLNATLPTLFFSLFNNDWDVEKIDDYLIDENDTKENIEIREKIYLKQANSSAVINAYKLANIDIDEINVKNNIIYIDSNANTNLKVGDQITKINDIKIKNINDIISIVNENEIGDKLKITALRNNNEKELYATIYQDKETKKIGIATIATYDYEVDGNIKFNFDRNESGPSGGLMMALTIYNKLTKEDLTNGLNIAGTGTMELDGTVGEIGGIKYKLAGAVKEKMDIFIAPTGENYEEAMKIKKEKKLKIRIIEAKNLKQVIDELNKL